MRATSFEGIAPQGATPSKTAGAVRATRRRAGSSVRHGVVFVESGNA
jgi:hypothetical protein